MQIHIDSRLIISDSRISFHLYFLYSGFLYNLEKDGDTELIIMKFMFYFRTLIYLLLIGRIETLYVVIA